MKLRILLLARELHQGGSERQMTEIALALDRAHFEPHVGAFRLEGFRADELRSAGIPLVPVPVRSLKSPGALLAARRLAAYIRANEIRLVHTFDMPLTTYAIPITRLLTPAVALASQRSHLNLTPGFLRKPLLFSERLAHGVVVNCEFLQRHLIEEGGIPPARIHLCRNGVDLARFNRLPHTGGPASFTPESLVIGVVCVLRPEKGLNTLLDAFAMVRRTAANLRLVIVGSGPVLPDLQRRARELGIGDVCIFEPATNHVADWLRGIDIFVLPSLSEALSNSLMEAMACGCCCIASRVGGNPELIEDGVRGLLFPPGDAAALAEALRQTITHKVFRKRLADAGHDYVHANFSRLASARRMAEIYSEFLHGKAGANGFSTMGYDREARAVRR